VGKKKEDDHLRALVSKELGIERMPPKFWQTLQKKGLTQEPATDLRGKLLQGWSLEDIAPDPDFAEFMDLVRSYYDFFDAGRPPRPAVVERSDLPQPPREDVQLTAVEQARAKATSYLHALRATGDSRVVDFRDRFLEGSCLTQEQAWKMVEEQRVLRWQANSLLTEQHGDTAQAHLLPYYGRDNGLQHARYCADTPLASLHALAHALVLTYPWTEAGAVRFVLTGIPPVVSPIRVEWGTTVRAPVPPRWISITVEPWLTPDKVKEVYAEEQVLFLPQRGDRRARSHAKAWGKKGTARTYKVLAFVLQHLYNTSAAVDTTEPPFIEAVIYDAWQAHCKRRDLAYAYGERDVAELAYKEPGGLKLFRQDFRRAWHGMVGRG
jgi:hypothetical protein